MKLAEFEPENELERAVAEAKRDGGDTAPLLALIARSPLFISSQGEVAEDGTGFEPVLLQQGGQALVAAFTSLSRPEIYRDRAEYVLQMTGRDLLLRMPPGYGIVLNPGFVTQFIITPAAVSELRESLSSR
ncbi:MAG TPA: SseB family protein [Allosphingosinicella sp.]|nr:SseB family protein [Allosphingosinicella sp.]